MAVQVDPFVIPLPAKLASDPQLEPYFRYTNKFLHDMWNRTGAGEDFIGGHEDRITQNEIDIAINAANIAINAANIAINAAEIEFNRHYILMGA